MPPMTATAPTAPMPTPVAKPTPPTPSTPMPDTVRTPTPEDVSRAGRFAFLSATVKIDAAQRELRDHFRIGDSSFAPELLTSAAKDALIGAQALKALDTSSHTETLAFGARKMLELSGQIRDLAKGTGTERIEPLTVRDLVNRLIDDVGSLTVFPKVGAETIEKALAQPAPAAPSTAAKPTDTPPSGDDA